MAAHRLQGGSTIPGVLQARTLEWVAISFSNAWKWKVKAKSLSRVRPFTTPWTAVYKAPPSVGFSRQECWSGVPLSSLLPWWLSGKEPTCQGSRISSLGREDPLGKEIATHSSILAWIISWTEELGWLQSMGSPRIRHDWTTNTFTFLSSYK